MDQIIKKSSEIFFLAARTMVKQRNYVDRFVSWCIFIYLGDERLQFISGVE